MNILRRDTGPEPEDRNDKSRKTPPRVPRPGMPKRGTPVPLGPGSRPGRTAALWALIVVITVLVAQFYFGQRQQRVDISDTRFIEEMNKGNIKKLVVTLNKDANEVQGELKVSASVDVAGRPMPFKEFRTWYQGDSNAISKMVWDKNPGIEIVSRPKQMDWMTYLGQWLPFVILILAWFFLIRQMQSGGSAALKFGKSRAKVTLDQNPRITFKDVAGCDEAKSELQEIVEFLKDPQKFQRLGGRIPKGALLLGPPGTGKTLLAKAVAGEAGVPFFSMSGSDFVEMFVGVGASRVRDLFEQSKRNAPAIVFIDEIDAVGRHRGAGLGGGHDEREQTLNQLLVEMDGFDANDGVILIAATNRPDVLDPALLRPGRFDRQVVVDWPDVRGREGILRVHTREIPLGPDVELKQLAQETPGMSGADLANMVNEAALLAARRNKKKVEMQDMEDARDKVTLGVERKSMVINPEQRRRTAYHESGHAIVNASLPGTDPVVKVTIIPRGRALGLTAMVPAEDRLAYTRDELLSRVAGMLGGRAADMIVFGEKTTGASNDIEAATNLARKMVCEWGMSERIGPLALGHKEEMVFLGKDLGSQKNYSEETAEAIDAEVRVIVDGGLQRALGVLNERRELLELVASSLLEREQLDAEDMRNLMSGVPLPPFDSSRRRDEGASTPEAGPTAAPAAPPMPGPLGPAPSPSPTPTPAA
jgi:cell division protease FtsH